MVPDCTQMPVEIQGMFDSDTTKVYLGINASRQIIKTASMTQASTRSEVTTRLNEIFTNLNGANFSQLRVRVANVVAAARYPEQPAQVAHNAAAAAGVMPQPQASRVRSSSEPPLQAAVVSPGPGPVVSHLPPGLAAPLAQAAPNSSSSTQQPTWAQRTANVRPSFLATSRDVATQEVSNGSPGTFRFYEGRDDIQGRLYIKLSPTKNARIDLPNDLDLERFASYLTTHYQEIAGGEAFSGIFPQFRVSNAGPGPGPILATTPNVSGNASQAHRAPGSPSSAPINQAAAAQTTTQPAAGPVQDVSYFVVADENTAERALRNTGDYRFYTKPASPDDNRDLKRIMMKLPYGNIKVQIEDRVSFADFYNTMQCTPVLLSRLSRITSRSEEQATPKLNDKNPIQIILNSADRPAKIIIHYNGHNISVDVPSPGTITPKQLLNEMEKHYCLITRGARNYDEACKILGTLPQGTKVFYRSSQDPNNIRVVEKIVDRIFYHSISPQQDFIDTLATISSTEFQLSLLRKIPDLIDPNVEAAQKRLLSRDSSGFAFWIEGNQLHAMIRIPGPTLIHMSQGSGISPFSLFAYLDDSDRQFNLLEANDLTSCSEVAAEAVLVNEPVGSFRVVKGTNSYVVVFKSATGIEESDESNKPLFQFLDEILVRLQT